MAKTAVKRQRHKDGPASRRTAPVPPHLAATDHEARVTDFEQTLICAAEAFYRFAGALLGPEARKHNLSGQDCVILQQLVTAGQPRRIGDLMRFANRDDVSNVQYSLRKLIKAGLARQVKGSTNRDTGYTVTENGLRVSARLVARRRTLLMNPTRSMAEFDPQLQSLTVMMGILTGLYDHGARVLAARD